MLRLQLTRQRCEKNGISTLSDDYHIPGGPKLGPDKYDFAKAHLEAVAERVWNRAETMLKTIGTNAIMRIKYSLAGDPYGDDEAGYARFVVEQAIKEEMEAVKDHYGRNDADIEPN